MLSVALSVCPLVSVTCRFSVYVLGSVVVPVIVGVPEIWRYPPFGVVIVRAPPVRVRAGPVV